MKRNILIVCMILVFFAILFCINYTLRPVLTFATDKYEVCSSRLSKVTEGYITKYCKNGDKDSSEFFTVFTYPQESSAIDLAKDLTQVIRMFNDKAGVQLMENSSEKSAVVDFLTWDPKDVDNEGFVPNAQFNVIKYKPDTRGIISFQYTRNLKFKDLDETYKFLDGFPEFRNDMVNTISSMQIPPAYKRNFEK